MANNRAFVVGSIFGGIIATIVVGNVLSHSRNTDNKTTDSEPKTDDTVSYSDAVNAIVSSGMVGMVKEEMICAMPIDMSSAVYKSIVCVVRDEKMLSASKRDTVLKICEQFREKNKPSNERM